MGEYGLPKLDRQMVRFADHLGALKIDAAQRTCLATSIRRDVAALPEMSRREILQGEHVTFHDRLHELVAFQGFMDLVHALPPDPRLVRAEVITQNYLCFVYLSESCFRSMRRASAPGTALRRCSQFLTDNPVRAFRNAIAHANWRYADDFSGLEFWAKKGADSNDEYVRWEVSQEELSFWQALARCTAYAAHLS